MVTTAPMNKIALLCVVILTGFVSCKKEAVNNTVPKETGIYAYKVTALNGSTIDFSAFKGKKILVVNTASECQYTYQYEALETLFKKYNDRLVIVGFPSNDFGLQEPGTNEQIADFCKDNYGVTFPMAAKIAVNGNEIAPIYQWLTQKEQNGYENSTVEWNFQKYLIDENGKLVGVFASKVEPGSEELKSAIEK